MHKGVQGRTVYKSKTEIKNQQTGNYLYPKGKGFGHIYPSVSEQWHNVQLLENTKRGLSLLASEVVLDIISIGNKRENCLQEHIFKIYVNGKCYHEICLEKSLEGCTLKY